jgi:hypothetical protein
MSVLPLRPRLDELESDAFDFLTIMFRPQSFNSAVGLLSTLTG